MSAGGSFDPTDAQRLGAAELATQDEQPQSLALHARAKNVKRIDYHDQHAYAYHLLGLKDRRKAEIGPAINGSSHWAKRQYQLDIAKVFRRTVEAMIEGGFLIVVIHDSANLYSDIASLCGVEVVAVLDRHVNRRTGRRSSQFYESIYIWRKS